MWSSVVTALFLCSRACSQPDGVSPDHHDDAGVPVPVPAQRSEVGPGQPGREGHRLPGGRSHGPAVLPAGHTHDGLHGAPDRRPVLADWLQRHVSRRPGAHVHKAPPEIRAPVRADDGDQLRVSGGVLVLQSAERQEHHQRAQIVQVSFLSHSS